MIPGTFAEALRTGDRPPRLVIRYPNWVGDAVMALPALEAVRRTLPEIELIVLAKPWVAAVATMSGLTDRVMSYDAPGEHQGLGGKCRLIGEIRRERARGALLLQNAFEAALLSWAAMIPYRAGYASDGRGFLLSHRVPPTPGNWPLTHQVGYYLDLVRALGFTVAVDEVPRLSVTPVSFDAPTVVFAPGASFGPAKMWPAPNWIDLGKRLAAGGRCIVLLGSGSEEPACAAVAAGIGEACVNRAGETTLEEAASILAGARLAVTNDSGLMHLAAAVGTPLVAVFGSTDPEATGPLHGRSRVLRGTAACAPCFRRACDHLPAMACFNDLTVDKVEAVTLELLAEKR